MFYLPQIVHHYALCKHHKVFAPLFYKKHTSKRAMQQMMQLWFLNSATR